MVTAAEFWASKRRNARFDTITFYHPEFTAPFRLVANVFESVTLGGNVYTPAPMEIGQPAPSSDAQPRSTISFPRAVVGRQFKQQLALIRAAGSVDPIEVTTAVWLEDTDAPKITWPLYVNSVSFGQDTVQVQAGLTNPMKRFGQPVYLPSVFTGLQGL